MFGFIKRLVTRANLTTTLSRLMGGWGIGGTWPHFDQARAVAHFRSWVYSASMIVAQEIAKQPLRLYMRERAGKKLYRTRALSASRKRYLHGDGETQPSPRIVRRAAHFHDFVEVVEPHPTIEVLHRANPYANGFDLTLLRFVYLQLTGNAYLMPVVNKGTGAPDEVWLLPSQWVMVKPGMDNLVAGYFVGSGPTRQEYSADQVIQFKLPNPSDIYYGMGRLEAAWSALGLHVLRRKQDLAVFENMSRPDWLVVLKSGVTPEALDRFERRVESALKGVGKTGSMLSVSGDVDVKQLSFPPQVIGDPDRLLDEISSVFGVPRAMLTGNQNVAGGGSEQADTTFLRGTILPYLRMDEERLNEAWLPLFDVGDDAFLAYDNPIQEDRRFLLERRTQLVNAGILTRNEARTEEGLETSDELLADALMVNGRPLGAEPVPQVGVNVSPSTPVPQTPQSADIETTQASVLNGAQVMAAMAIVTAVASGEIPRDAGIGQLEVLFNLSTEQAERIMGSAGTSTPTTPNPNPAAAVPKEVVQAPGKAIDLSSAMASMPAIITKPSPRLPGESSDDCMSRVIHFLIAEGKPPDQAAAIAHEMCGSHNETALGIFLDDWFGPDEKSCCGHSTTKADASNTQRDDEPERPGRTMAKRLLIVLGKIESDLLGSLSKAKRKALTPADVERIVKQYEKDIAEAVTTDMEKIITSGMKAGLTEVGKPEIFNVNNPAAADSARKFALALADTVSQTTIDRVKNTVAVGLEQGATGAQIAGKIKDTGLFSSARAEAIARTESARAYVSGTIQGWKDSGVVVGKKWLLAPNACPFCTAASKAFNTQVRPLDATVQSVIGENSIDAVVDGKPSSLSLDYAPVSGGGTLHPNCRCFIVPILEGE